MTKYLVAEDHKRVNLKQLSHNPDDIFWRNLEEFWKRMLLLSFGGLTRVDKGEKDG